MNQAMEGREDCVGKTWGSMMGSTRDWRFLAAIALISGATLWAWLAKAAFPSPVECGRLVAGLVLAAMVLVPVAWRARAVILHSALLAWLILNLYEARWLGILTTNLNAKWEWSPSQTASNDYWVFYHAAHDTYVSGGSPYAVGNHFPIPTYWFIHLLAGVGRLPIESAGTIFWVLNLLALAAVVAGSLALLRPLRPASRVASILMVLVLLTSNPVMAALAMGQTIILALGFWFLGILLWDRGRSPWREMGCAGSFVVAGMIKPPLLIFIAAFGVRAAIETLAVAMGRRPRISTSAQVGWWSLAFFAGLIGIAISLPGGVTWQAFWQFPGVAHSTQVTAGRSQVFNFSLPFIMLNKLDKAGILSLDRWIEVTNLLLGGLAATLFAKRLGPLPLTFRDIAPGLLIPPFVFGAFWSYYAAWFLPFLLWCGWLILGQAIPPRGQAIAWIGLALLQVFSSPLFLVGASLLLLAGDYTRQEAYAEQRVCESK